MIKLYIKKIQNKEITIDDVPPFWREIVRKELEKT